MNPELLIAGGSKDPNIACLVSAACKAGVKFAVAYADLDKLCHTVGQAGIAIGGTVYEPKAVFARFNVFGYDPNDTSTWWYYHNWHTAVCDSLPKAKFLNRQDRRHSKLSNLYLAKKHGLRVPWTDVTSVATMDGIAKPLNGGDHTQPISYGDKLQWGHGFVQTQLTGQEYRIYVVGDYSVTFTMTSPSLDYREKQDAVVAVAEPLEKETKALRGMMADLGLQFAAADLKCDDHGPLFLEINDGPMFVAFDPLVNGAITSAIIETLK